MERIRGFKARRGNRTFDGENNPEVENVNVSTMKKVKKREEYQGQKVKMDKKELEMKYLELQAKLDDSECFWKDDSRRKEKRLSELERQNKALEDSSSFLSIKLKMMEQEIADQREENARLNASLEAVLKENRALKREAKYSNKLY